MKTIPLTDDVVLIGGGHTHALVLRRWGMSPLAGARLTLINPGPTAPYSGMLPGHIAGHYDREALDIDLVRLSRFAGARLILGAAEHIDPVEKSVFVPGRAPIPFDLCSVDIGVTARMPDLLGFADHAVPAKPLGGLADAWASYLAKDTPAKVAVIGGGVAGVELAMAMAFALQTRRRAFELTVLDRGQALGAVRPRSAAMLRRRLADLGIRLLEGVEIAKITPQGILLTDEKTVAAEFVTGAAGALPYEWLAGLGLRQTDGFLDVSETLQTSDPDIFAVGDCAHLSFAPRPKAGVYAVREAPVLFDNLRARLTGSSLRRYKPQDDYLKLISLGERSALAEKFGLSPAGPLMWRLKDRIDRTFMNQFRDLPGMAAPALPALHTKAVAEQVSDVPPCGGCGAKVGRSSLFTALDAPPEDAAILHTGNARQVISTDHLSAVTDDPYLMARIAAVHALGDVWAMGAAPQAATASVVLPRMTPTLQARSLNEIMKAARAVFAEAGAEIVGGHTTLGEALTIGFTVTGLCDGEPITLTGARAGDCLILTKPIGSGVILAADMRLLARGADVAAAHAFMVQPQSDAAHVLRTAHAMTDVTGFGLAGHLLNICEASGVSARVDLDAIPILPGARALSDKGVRSTLYEENRKATDLPDSPETALLFDPQTCGGLLAAVAADDAPGLLDALEANGYTAARIGWLESGPPDVKTVNTRVSGS